MNIQNIDRPKYKITGQLSQKLFNIDEAYIISYDDIYDDKAIGLTISKIRII